MSALTDWQPGSFCSFNLKNEVHVWRILFSATAENDPRLRAVLSAEEIRRAEKFYFKKDRVAFVAAHGYLRLLLARYLHTRAEKLVFSEGEHGKPFLKNYALQFNISHSQGMGLLAFDASLPLGVDVEHIRPDFGGLKIARRFFSEAEVKELSVLKGEAQLHGFFNGWSRKEAYIKALGRGLSLPLHKFTVSLDPTKKAQLISTEHDHSALERWRLFALDVGAEYKAALVTSKDRKIIRLFEVDQI